MSQENALKFTINQLGKLLALNTITHILEDFPLNVTPADEMHT